MKQIEIKTNRRFCRICDSGFITTEKSKKILCESCQKKDHAQCPRCGSFIQAKGIVSISKCNVCGYERDKDVQNNQNLVRVADKHS